MKSITTIILCLLCLTTVGADKKLEHINTIKKSSSYLYADVTMPTLEDATSQAYEQLQHEVYRWMEEEKISAIEINSIADTIITQRANMFRVFAYASKTDLRSAVETDAQEDLQTPTCPPHCCDSTNSSVEDNAIPEKDLLTYSLSQRRDTTRHKNIVAGDTIRQLLMHSFLGHKGRVIEQIKKARTFFELRQIMEPLKAKGDIADYGKYATAKKPEDCYLIIYDPAGNIRALLGKGEEGTRSNMITGKADGIANYRGCGAIWFKLRD